MLNKGFNSGVGYGSMDSLADNLKTIGLLDVGKITHFSTSTYRASVELYNIVAGEQQVINNVEVMFPGNSANGLFADPVGSPCLVIYPRAPVTSTRTETINTSRKSYDSVGVKCIPLSTCQHAHNFVGFNSVGDFGISGTQYTCTWDERSISVSLNNGNAVIYMSGADGIIIRNNQTVTRIAPDGTISHTIIDFDTQKTLVSCSLNSAGAITIQQGDTSDTINTINISTSGITIQTTQTVSLSSDSGISVTGDLSLEGDVKIEGELEVTGNFSAAGGNLTAEAS